MDAAAPPRNRRTILIRGLRRRCPWCGQGELFSRWLKIRERCPRCGLIFEREEASFLGSLTLNFGVTVAAWIALLVTWLAMTLPDVRWQPLLVTSMAVVILLPIILYPFTKTTWAAIDLLLHGAPNFREPEDARSFGLGGDVPLTGT